MSEEEMIQARDAFYSGLDNGEPRHWRDVGPDEIWDAAWRAALNLRQQVPDGWALVPKRCDGSMLDAAQLEAEICDETASASRAMLMHIVEAAIAAAPKPEDVK